jgi:hypothetical protein
MVYLLSLCISSAATATHDGISLPFTAGFLRCTDLEGLFNAHVGKHMRFNLPPQQYQVVSVDA